MNNFGCFFSPKELIEKRVTFKGGEHTIEYWENLAKKKPKKCISCHTENEWKLGETELCFSCTTGEADASDDCEIEELWRTK